MQSQWLRYLPRALIAIVVSGVAFDALLPLLLPLYAAVIAWLAPEFHIVALLLSQTGAEATIALHVDLAKTLVIGSEILPPGMGLTSSTVRGHALQAPILIISILMVWPGIGVRARIALATIALPVIVLLELVDIPVVLVGSARDLLVTTFAPTAVERPWSIYWMYFLDGGGRLCLALTTALLLIVGYRHYALKK